MDPNIMKLLEDDEDDAMHSGADVEAFAAALNRDIEGDNNEITASSPPPPQPPPPPPSESETSGGLPPGSNSTPNQLFTQSQDSKQEENPKVDNNDEEMTDLQCQDQNSSEMEVMQSGSGPESQEQHVGSTQGHNQLQSQEKDDKLQLQSEQKPPQASEKSVPQTSEQNPSHFGEQERVRQPENQLQYPNLPKVTNQQILTEDSENRGKQQVSFGMLLPVILPHLDKDRAMQLQTLYSKLRKNEIHKDGFVRHMRNIVGDQMLRQAVHKIQQQHQNKAQAAQNSQTVSHQVQPQSQTSSQQQLQVKMPSLNASQFTDSQPFSQLNQKGQRGPTDSTPLPSAKVEVQSDSSFPSNEIKVLKRENEQQSDPHGLHVNQVSSSSMVNQEKGVSAIQGLHKQQQQQQQHHLHLPPTSYQMYPANMSSYHSHSYSGQSVGISSTSHKSQTQDSQIRQVSHHQGMVPTHPGGTTQTMSSMSVQNYDIQNSSKEPKRLHGGSFSQMTTQSTLQHNPVPWQSSAGQDKKGSSLASMPFIKQEVVSQPQEQHIPQISASSSSTFSTGKVEQSNPALPGTHPISVSMTTQLDSSVPVSHHQGVVPTPAVGTTQPMGSISLQNKNVQNSSKEPTRLHGGSFSHMTTQSTLQYSPVPWHSSVGQDKKGSTLASMPCIKQEVVTQNEEQRTPRISVSLSSTSSFGKVEKGNPTLPGTHSISVSMPTQLDSSVPVRNQVPSTITSLGPGTNIKTPPKKPSIGQKKPFEALGTSSALPSKKQKVSGGFLDQSIEQLNDVTTVSGVNLREEEEQLFSGSKEESRASEATRRVVQEEEERLILQKLPFQKKLAKIMSKCAIKNASKDVERCLSLCLEERMRGIISNLIRVSKQRVDIEKSRHRTIITSDVRRQISVMNRKAKEDWEKKQAEEAEKIRRTDEADGNTGLDGDKDKDDGRSKGNKGNKEEDDKMRTTAANVAARVAVGGDDMLSKWQLMAEQARQKREGVDPTSSTLQMGKDVITRKPSSTTGRTSRETQDNEGRSPSTGSGLRKFGRNPTVMPHTKVARTICVKDVIAVLEREPQMSKSTLVYRLYERMGMGTGTTDAPTTD